MRRIWTIAPLAVALLVAGCGESGGGGSDRSPGSELRGHTFVSRAMSADGKPYSLARNSRLTLRFTQDGLLIADAGCNIAQGRVDLSDERIAVADPGITEMGCPEALRDQDRWLTALLGAMPTWELTDGTLVLGTSRYDIELVDEEVLVPDLPLLDTTWRLYSTISGGSISHSEAMATVTMSLAGSRVDGVSACGTFAGDVAVVGSSVTFIGLARGTPGIRACNDGEKAVERRVLEALTGRVTATIHQDRLILRTGSGEEFVWVGTP